MKAESEYLFAFFAMLLWLLRAINNKWIYFEIRLLHMHCIQNIAINIYLPK